MENHFLIFKCRGQHWLSISNQIRYPFGVQGCKDLCQPPFSALPLRPVILWVIGDEKVSLQTACFISLRFYQLASDGHELLIICDNPASDIIIDFSFYKSINVAPIKYDFAKKILQSACFLLLSFHLPRALMVGKKGFTRTTLPTPTVYSSRRKCFISEENL